MRTSEDRMKTELRRERYESRLAGLNRNSVEQRIADAREKREAAQRIGTKQRK